MSEPFFIRQGTGLHTPLERQAWMFRQSEIAHKMGAQHFRITVHEKHQDRMLFEGWNERNPDEGPQRWLPDMPASLTEEKDNG